MKILASGLKAATQVRNSQGSVRQLSKVMTLGTSYRLLFPIQATENGERDVLIAAVPGRQLDYDKLGTSFVRLDDFEQTEMGKIIDNSGLTPYARIARVFHTAEYENERENARKEARELADRAGKTEIDAVGLNTKLTAIEEKYHGDKQHKPQPIYPAVNPIIGGVTITVATECLVIPLKSTGEPDWANVTTAAFDIRNRKAAQITALINNKDYCPEGSKFLEVGWTWAGKDSKEAGSNATLQGIAHELSLAVKFPESWEANKDVVDMLPKNSESIAARNMTMSSRTTPKEVVELFKKYMLGHAITLTYINYEDEITKAAAKDIIDFGIVDELPKVQDRLLALVNTDKEDGADADVDTAEDKLTAVQAEAVKSVETVGQLTQVVPDIDEVAGPDIDSL